MSWKRSSSFKRILSLSASSCLLSGQQAWTLGLGLVEAKFHLQNITDKRMRFYHVITSLPKVVVRKVADLVRGPTPVDAYTQLLAAHTLTNFARMEQLVPFSRWALSAPRISSQT